MQIISKQLNGFKYTIQMIIWIHVIISIEQ